MDLAGQTVVITGAASSTGEHIVRRLKALGATVIAMDRNCPRATADLYYRVDMTDLGSINEAVDTLPCGIDMLCNLSSAQPGRETNRQTCSYALGVRTFAAEALSLISSGGSIVNVSPLPAWSSIPDGTWHGRGIRVRHLAREGRYTSILAQLISELAVHSKTSQTHNLTVAGR